MTTVGLIANPLAGKDIRRLVARAGSVSDADKMSILRQAAVGAAESGATRLLIAPDSQRLAVRAIAGLDLGLTIEVADVRVDGNGADTVAAARSFRDNGVGAIVALGGDGTSRDVAKGWLAAPLVALSTGTNNVFPQTIEATSAGLAAGLLATGVVPITSASHRAKVLHVQVTASSGDPAGCLRHDLALVDVALIDGRFVGSRAVWDPDRLRRLAVTTAEPGSVGLSSVAAALRPVDRTRPGGLSLSFGPAGTSIRAALAPGLFAELTVDSIDDLADQPITWSGPGVLSFDGERGMSLRPDQSVTITLRTDGPRVVDVARVCELAVEARWFIN